MTVILPLAVTVMLWTGGSLAVGAPETGPPRTDSAAIATMKAPSATAPSVRSVCDIRVHLRLAAARKWDGRAAETTRTLARFPVVADTSAPVASRVRDVVGPDVLAFAPPPDQQADLDDGQERDKPPGQETEEQEAKHPETMAQAPHRLPNSGASSACRSATVDPSIRSSRSAPRR